MHPCIPVPESNNWHISSSVLGSRLWRMTGWGIKTKPLGDVGGKLRDFTGCAHSRAHIQKAWEHHDHKRRTDYCGKKKGTPPEDIFRLACTHAQPDIARGEG